MMRFVPRRANTNMRSTLSSNQRRRCSLWSRVGAFLGDHASLNLGQRYRHNELFGDLHRVRPRRHGGWRPGTRKADTTLVSRT